MIVSRTVPNDDDIHSNSGDKVGLLRSRQLCRLYDNNMEGTHCKSARSNLSGLHLCPAVALPSPGRRLRHWLIASKLHVVMKSTKVQTLGTTLVLWTHRICKMMISYIAKNSMTKLSSKILTCSIGSALGLSRMAYTAMHVRQHYARVTIHACQSWQNCNWLQVTKRALTSQVSENAAFLVIPDTLIIA